ncbi:MAG: hypothetical protein OZSIB_1773 [Candidatus Ozemobacter sibiricus]|jgi:hypothetical protein|uniref:Uncharacterized protein n=1 Tax=Candidatus Ozemobacter sibiricus TaxID=2268124 RepID=A0A367ZJ11_9BACT|nr:MAG: hypothetical protein OZSIB_1773 [Candidatus Ozemobacter sibiricus]
MSLVPFQTVTVGELAPAGGSKPGGRPSLPAGLDAAIRDLDRVCQMQGGAIELEFRTAPTFAAALPTWGERHQVVFLPDHDQGCGRDREVVRLGALGIRSQRHVWLNGEPRRVAYFHHLRIHPRWRGGTTLARGFRAFRREAEREPVAATFTAILSGNQTARALLENQDGRGPLPRYLPLCSYQTVLFPLRGPNARWPRRARPSPRVADLEIRALTPADRPALDELWAAGAAWHDGLPVLASGPEPLPDLPVTGFLGAWRAGRLVAAFALWDQSPVKPIRLAGGEGWWGHLWRLGRAVLGLPAPDQDIPYRLLDPWTARPGETRAVVALLDAALAQARGQGAVFAAWGVPAAHPMARVRQRFFHLPYASQIYQVVWPDETPFAVSPGHQFWLSLGML